jgi:hypothetical protein
MTWGGTKNFFREIVTLETGDKTAEIWKKPAEIWEKTRIYGKIVKYHKRRDMRK